MISYKDEVHKKDICKAADRTQSAIMILLQRMTRSGADLDCSSFRELSNAFNDSCKLKSVSDLRKIEREVSNCLH